MICRAGSPENTCFSPSVSHERLQPVFDRAIELADRLVALGLGLRRPRSSGRSIFMNVSIAAGENGASGTRNALALCGR